jgi:hypothetical protein
MSRTPSVPYKELLDDLRSPDLGHYAFQALLKATDSPVDWAYGVWDDLLRTLVNGDNRHPKDIFYELWQIDRTT